MSSASQQVFDYTGLDRFKIGAAAAARRTARNLEKHGYRDVAWSRGESVHLHEEDNRYYGRVIEGLGTKNLVADKMGQLLGRSYYRSIAQCTAATFLNDFATCGGQPLCGTMYIAVYEGNWFDDKAKVDSLLEGYEAAFNADECTWGCGETPGLKGIIVPGTAELCGSVDGEVKPKERVIRPRITAGDEIVLIGSSGPHANGFTDARSIVEKERLPRGYLTPIPGGQLYGEALLEPTILYGPFVRACITAGAEIRYAVNITGHGWRKLMRAQANFVYVIENVGNPQPVFPFIQQHAGFTLKKMYETYNMGAGWAMIGPARDAELICTIASKHGLHAWRAGRVEKHGEDKRVIIKHPEDTIIFEEDTLAIR